VDRLPYSRGGDSLGLRYLKVVTTEKSSGSRASCPAARMLQAIRYGAEVEVTSGEDKRSDNHEQQTTRRGEVMVRISPTQVVAFIERMCPEIVKWTPAHSRMVQLNFGYEPELSALVRLVDEMPAELMPGDADRYLEFVSSIAAVRDQLVRWQSGERTGALGHRTALGDLHPVALIRRALIGLPDDLPSAETATLPFIDEPVLKAGLRLDISWASSALRNREWKAATVIAGSVIEALLYWELEQHPKDEVPKVHKGALDTWYLPDYIDATEALGCVKKETITAARLAKNYRNLIHHGRALRLGEACDQGTAHVAIGALDHVVRDLERPECPRHKT
jgi:hypothetical protein